MASAALAFHAAVAYSYARSVWRRIRSRVHL